MTKKNDIHELGTPVYFPAKKPKKTKGKKPTELLPTSALGLPTPPPKDTAMVTFPAPMDQQDAVPTLGVTPFIDSEHRLPSSEICGAIGVQSRRICDDLSCGDNTAALESRENRNSDLNVRISSPLRDACLHYAEENRHQLIEKLAYARYERTGCTDAFVNWLWAERVLDSKLVGGEEWAT